MQTKKAGNLIFVRLFTGEDVIAALQKACERHKVKTAVIASALGAVKDAEIGYFVTKGKYKKKKFRRSHELLALTGSLTKQEGIYLYHIHATIADRMHRTFGGQLFAATANVTNEIILLCTNLSYERKLEGETGLKGMYLE